MCLAYIIFINFHNCEKGITVPILQMRTLSIRGTVSKCMYQIQNSYVGLFNLKAHNCSFVTGLQSGVHTSQVVDKISYWSIIILEKLQFSTCVFLSCVSPLLLNRIISLPTLLKSVFFSPTPSYSLQHQLDVL